MLCTVANQYFSCQKTLLAVIDKTHHVKPSRKLTGMLYCPLPSLWENISQTYHPPKSPTLNDSRQTINCTVQVMI